MESDLAVGLLRLMISVIAKDQHPETAPKKNVGESSYKTVQAKFHSLVFSDSESSFGIICFLMVSYTSAQEEV